MSISKSSLYNEDQLTDSQITEHFLNTFQLLSEMQKKIWRLLQWYSTGYRQVFPSHSTLAEKAGCSRATVIRAIKRFELNGWLATRLRCFRSNCYYLLGCLLGFDTRKNETFRRNATEDATVDATLYSTYSHACNVRYVTPQENVAVQDIKSENKQIISKMGISIPKDVFCLSRFSPRILHLAYEDLSSRLKMVYKFGPLRNIAAWVTDRCNKHKQKYGV